jgi:tRNA pseudouridine55 synthase
LPAQHESLNGLLVVDKPGRQAATGPTGPTGGTTTIDGTPPTTQPQRRMSRDVPALLTSHDVVGRVRRLSGQRRIGHTGTLDPMASGILVLCLGAATRLVEYYQGETKQYYAEVLLGCATDTYDALGVITDTAAVRDMDPAYIEQTLTQFRGAITQQPPAYSAIKQGGEALYRKARRGEVVTVPSRAITIFRLDLVDFWPPDRLALRVNCSAGAYVRSLAHDVGRALGTYGTLARLRREAVGAFTLEQAHSLEALEQAARAGAFAELLMPAGTGLPLPALTLASPLLQRLGHGQIVGLGESLEFTAGALAAAYDETHQLAGIVRCMGAAEAGELLWKAEKWLS